jgi:RNA polymerase-binding transcription factor DksA
MTEPEYPEPTPSEPAPSARELLAAGRAAATHRRTVLERDFAGLVDSAGQAGTDDEHDPEGATIAFERQHIAALIGQARGQLAEIEAALRRLDDGSYGVCERCGLAIAAERLAARPAAATCVRCAARR